MQIEELPIEALKPDRRNARAHPRKQLSKLKASLKRFQFCNPVQVDENNNVLAGHGRIEAAKLAGLTTVPVIRLSHLNEKEKRAYALADNRLALDATWDQELLASSLQELAEADFELEVTGFEPPEIDIVLDAAAEAKGPDRNDNVPEPRPEAVSRAGDLWVLGNHRLICGNARESGAYDIIMAGEKAEAVFTDPPYNLPIVGCVGGRGRIKHAEFAEASGEMNEADFTELLSTTCRLMKENSKDGSLHYLCMDWRHAHEMLLAGSANYAKLKNICVWNKSNGGMGSLYRSKHEFVFVWKHGTAPHINNVELGRHGRSRTNVWDYPGINAFGRGRINDLEMHPTVKPVALVADAIKDCSRRNSLVLDPFAGSGTTIIAAERTGRKARAIELDPVYVDVAVRRWQSNTGKTALLAKTGESFDLVEEQRVSSQGAARAA
jgi:DNA modification methylase